MHPWIFIKSRPRHHPSETGEEVRPVELVHGLLVDQPRLPVVVPGADAEEGGVLSQQGQSGQEILVEVGGHLQVVLNDDDLYNLGIFSWIHDDLM